MRIELITGSSGVAGAAGAPGFGGVTALEKVGTRSGGTGREVEADAETDAPPSVAGQDPAEVEAAVRAIEDAVREEGISLTFSRDEESGTMVMELVDQQTGEPVQQIPSEAQLRLAEALGKLQGNFVNQKV